MKTQKSRLIITLSLVLTLCFVLPAFASAELLDTVYFLPKDNVDYLLNPAIDYLIVGYHQPIPYDFMNIVEKSMVFVPNDVDGDTTGVENAAYTAYLRLKRDLLVNYGIEIGLYDAYRSLSDQAWLDSINGVETTGEYYSEHHTGLLLNIVVKLGEYYYEEEAVLAAIDESIPEFVYTSPAFAIVRDRLADYGFIVRFPEGKEAITGFGYIPNQIRFVGSSEVARAITANDLCLEEYLSSIQ